MPSCCLAFRTLCRNPRLPAHSSRVLPWHHHHHHHYHHQRQHQLHTATTTTTSAPASRKDDPSRAPAVNLNTASSDSAYLDFLLGSAEDGPTTRRVSSDGPILSGTGEHDHEHDVIMSSAMGVVKQRLTRRGRGGATRQSPEQRQNKLSSTAPVLQEGRLQTPQERAEPHFASSHHARSKPGLNRHRGTVDRSAKHGTNERNDRKGHKYSTESLPPQLRNDRLGRRSDKRLVSRDAAGLEYSTPWSFPETRFQAWLENVKLLSKRIRENSQPSDTPHPAPAVPILSPMVFDLVGEVYCRLEAGTSINSLFSIHHGRWPLVLLWFLHYDSSAALDFLLASNFPLKSHKHWSTIYRREALQCLATEYWYNNDEANLKRLADVFQVLTRGQHSTSQMSTHGFVYRALNDHFSDEALSAVYGDLKRFHHRHVHWATWLRFAITFSKRQKAGQSLDALLESKNAGADVNAIPFRKVCSMLVRKTASMPGGLRACIRIVDSMFKIGLTLNNNLANIIMLNAVEAGDIKTTMDIYHSLRDHGLQPDRYTFAILLKACKLDIENADMLNSTIRAAIASTNVLEAPIVATELLHCLALHHVRTNREQVFYTVADAYAQLFTVGPLRLVGLLPANLSRVDRYRDSRRPQPRSQDIYIVLSTFLEQSFCRDKSVASAYDTWQRFKYVIEAGEEPFASMIQTDHIFNAFLSTFTKTNKGMLHAAEVVKYMQLPDEAGAKYQRMRPTVQTWSIFLHGFTRNGQLRLAEQVLTYMRSKSIQPNTVTYNSLLSGYVAERDLDGVLDSIRRIETDGLTWDEWTRKYLNRSKDVAEIQTELKRNKEWRTLDFTADLKQNLETRIEAFTPSAQLQVRAEGEDIDKEQEAEAQRS